MLKTQYELEKTLENLDSLYEKDPEQFEDLRKEIIDQTISSYPEKFQQRARGIQFTLDCELNKYKNPLVRMNRMVELFWEQFAEFQAVVSDPVNYTVEQEETKTDGKVISLF